MNAANKRWIKKFLIQQLDHDWAELRLRLHDEALKNGVHPYDAMVEYQYQIERVLRFLNCH